MSSIFKKYGNNTQKFKIEKYEKLLELTKDCNLSLNILGDNLKRLIEVTFFS